MPGSLPDHRVIEKCGGEFGSIPYGDGCVLLFQPGRLQGSFAPMWNQPYLETCCRAALHRLVLSADDGRPGAMKDGPCLERLTGMGFARMRDDERYEVTDAGRERHSSEILHSGRAA